MRYYGTTMTKQPDNQTGYASPACFAHELEYSDEGFVAVDPVAARDVARWREAERQRLVSLRMEIPADQRQVIADEVAAELDQLIAPRPGVIVSVYWPYKGELDLRKWMHGAWEKGAQVALPVVVAKDSPMIFRQWTPSEKMERGVLGILIPANGAKLVPNVVISPLIGYDKGCFRLGYGGGFFDRTLASLSPRPRVIGVGQPCAEIPTIYPQPHDIPMDVIVTGKDRVFTR